MSGTSRGDFLMLFNVNDCVLIKVWVNFLMLIFVWHGTISGTAQETPYPALPDIQTSI